MATGTGVATIRCEFVEFLGSSRSEPVQLQLAAEGVDGFKNARAPATGAAPATGRVQRAQKGCVLGAARRRHGQVLYPKSRLFERKTRRRALI